MSTDINSGFIKPKRSLFFGAAWLFFGGIFLASGIFLYTEHLRFENEAVQTEGTVLAKTFNSKRENNKTTTTYYVTYSFSDQNARERENQVSVSKETWEAISEGSKIGIEFLPDKPTSSRLIGGADEEIIFYVFSAVGGLMILLGAAFMFFDIKQRLKSSRLMKTGIQTIGTIIELRNSSFRINGVTQLKVAYKFKDRMGKEIEAESTYLAPEIARNIEKAGQCKVYYNKDNPSENIML